MSKVVWRQGRIRSMTVHYVDHYFSLRIAAPWLDCYS